MDRIPIWQVLSLSTLLSWIVFSCYFKVTQKLRSLTQPWVTQRVIAETPFILQIQSFQHRSLDVLFSALSCSVSVPFYTAFLPLLLWSGHCKLARQMTLLMALCDYVGNSIKDAMSAPRPSSPPVRRVTATKDEIENAMEYGFPSSHTLHTVCLAGYLLHYANISDATQLLIGVTMACLFVGLIALGRIYLGMHSVVDVLAGLVLGLVILPFWLTVDEYVDSFIVSGQNVASFWAILSVLLLFAYPTPELPTPSFEYHTAFNGVVLGFITGIQKTYLQFHHEDMPRLFSPQLSFTAFATKMIVGIPTILVVKFCWKSLAKWILPVMANTFCIPIRSSCYIPHLNSSVIGKESDGSQKNSKFLFFSQKSFDVDTGIRFLHYAGLAWSFCDPIPSVFAYLGL